MSMRPDLLTVDFRAMSARLGQDPLQVQGPGGNTSIKGEGVMWIKASGTELADAETAGIFVAVDQAAARAEAFGAGDGSCKETTLDPAKALRPSIETTFHAALDHPVVAHTHSVATLVHAVSEEGLLALKEKLAGLAFAVVPYAKPGLPLTREILARAEAATQIFILQNHGLICAGADVAEVSALIKEVEDRLALPANFGGQARPLGDPDPGFEWAQESWLAHDARAAKLALSGSYYPDHVVFLGPALPAKDHAGAPPVILREGKGVLIREGATSSQRAMLRCLSDVLARLPSGWVPRPIGADAEGALLNWDAEKYRQALAAQS